MSESLDGAEPESQPFGQRIDSLLPDSWPPATLAALERWKQGDVLEGAPLFWAGPAGQDPVIAVPGSATGWTVHDDGEGPGWLIITSQTCDVVGSGPGRVHPFVSMSPVYPLPETFNENKRAAVVGGEVKYLVPLTSPPAAGLFVADLRVSMPVSKGALVNASPIEVWANESDRLDFGEWVAAKTRRPALHSVLSEDLSKSLNAYVKTTHKSEPEWWEKVEQVRLLLEGDRLSPTAVTVLVLSEPELDHGEKRIWRGWRKSGQRLLTPHRIKLTPLLFSTMEKLPARLYQRSVPLFLDALQRPDRW